MTASGPGAEGIVQLAKACPLGDRLTAADLLERFASQQSWEQRYRLLIQLGRHLPALPPRYKTADHLVDGCESQAWLAAQVDQGRLWLLADSDARIIKGLLAVMVAAVNGRPLSEVRAFDWQHYFEQLQLLQHLSPSRGNGLRAIARRIGALADAS